MQYIKVERLLEVKFDGPFHSSQLTKNGTQDCEAAARLTVDDLPEEEEEEEEEAEGEEQKAVEADPSGANPDEGSSSSFLHPYASKQRHALLKAAGVKKIDKEEKRQLHELRLSREKCGCDCQGFCEPETCGCSLAGIKCQVLGTTTTAAMPQIYQAGHDELS